jgi:hypothetical protein
MGTESEYSSLSDAAILLLFKDACTRYGELEHKKFIAALFGIAYEIPQALVDQVEAYGAEVFKRMQG